MAVLSASEEPSETLCLCDWQSGYFRGLRLPSGPSYNRDIMRVRRSSNSHLPECWLHFLVGPRRYRAVLPSNRRPSLFGGD